MSIWRADQDPPTDLLELLYTDEVEIFDEEGGYDGSDLSETDVEDEDAGRPNDASTSSVPREVTNSRSPLSFSSKSATVPADGVVLRTLDEFGVPLDERTTGDEFLAPDTHLLYASTGERERDEGNRRRGTSERRGVRGVRGQSARGVGVPNRDRRGGRQWQLGQPVRAIWLHDDDVPPELLRLATDVLRRRQRRLQGDALADSTERGRVASESKYEFEFFDAKL
ncbi:uncharacterized protein LOC121728227 [Aricia agestis]|uniref:uncharacterized protein LOC121728227 n=1 Tax=Aricia agestis TaxID=91739 RepID=UPI001C205E8B|nr:uncharacterized protein LOC121728227 [Aricia agestis]